ncbi:hypothetical protein GYH30_024557 [Glycine max]|nr:hypothetical protein GYH30_024557 [Glycine max]
MSYTFDSAVAPPLFLLPAPQQTNSSIETPLSSASPSPNPSTHVPVRCSIVNDFGGKALRPPPGECPLDPCGSGREDTWNASLAMCPCIPCGNAFLHFTTVGEPLRPRTCLGTLRNRVLPFASATLEI